MRKILVEKVPRKVIENKLLIALDDKSKVAIVATKEDLEVMIQALWNFNTPKSKNLSLGLGVLKEKAFGD